MTNAQDLNDEQLFDELVKAAVSTDAYTLACEARNRHLKLKANLKVMSKIRDELEKEIRASQNRSTGH